jgi:hypothetical protein
MPRSGGQRRSATIAGTSMSMAFCQREVRSGCSLLGLVFVCPNPLAHRVIGHPVLPPDCRVIRLLEFPQQLPIARTLSLSAFGLGTTRTGITRAAFLRAVLLVRVPRRKLRPATCAVPWSVTGPTSTVSVETRVAVRTHDAEVLQAIVVVDAVDVIKHQGNVPPVPLLSLLAELTRPLLETFVVEPPFEVRSVVGRSGGHHLRQRDAMTNGRRGSPRPIGVEVLGGYVVPGNQRLERPKVSSRRAEPERSERIRETAGIGDGGSHLGFGVGR